MLVYEIMVEEKEIKLNADKGIWQSCRNGIGCLGPGLVTGASDDDPSGIATYSQAGAAYGYGLLWSVVLTLPLMAAIQEISARLGRITGRGIAGNIRRHYSRWILYPVVLLLLIANVINLGADLGAMGDAMTLLAGGSARVWATLLAVLCLYLEIMFSYQRYCRFLKWLTLVLFSYIVTAFMIHIHWKLALKNMILPSFQTSGAYWATVIGVLGTTISPYLFFWQASMETEEMHAQGEEKKRLESDPIEARKQFRRIRLDTYVGMAFSNLVAFFIILTVAATLNENHITDIQTSAQAAEALKPLAGRFAFVLFALGIIGTGLLAVPVLAGSAAYAVGEALAWPTGLDRKPLDAKAFYGVLTVATLLGLAINFPAVQSHTHLSPVKALFWAAVVNGILAVPIMGVMMLMYQNPKVVGKFAQGGRILRFTGWLATLTMALAAGGLFLTWGK